MKSERTIAISVPATGKDEWLAVREPLESGWLTQGPKVAEFESAFAQMHAVDHALAVTSCTTALHIILAGMGVGPGDEVIVPAFTWVATANAVVYCGATPVFVDIDPRTYNIDPAQVAEKISERTRAVCAAHLFGRCAEMDAVRAVVPDHIPIVEDAACAAGAYDKGRAAGSMGVAGAFSFHPRKSITTGEGGMVTTKDTKLADIIGRLRNHGAALSEAQRLEGAKPYLLPDFDDLGYNYRMTDLQGAIGLVQLRKLDAFITERAAFAALYSDQLSTVDWLRLPTEPEGGRHAWQAYVTYVDPELAPIARNEMMDRLQAKGIATRPGTHAVHMLGYYRERFGLKPSDFPGAWACDQNTMAIPLHNKMSADDCAYIADAIQYLTN